MGWRVRWNASNKYAPGFGGGTYFSHRVSTVKLRTLLFQNLLSPKGHFYLVVLKQNNISRILQHMVEVYHLKGEVSEQFTPMCHLIP